MYFYTKGLVNSGNRNGEECSLIQRSILEGNCETTSRGTRGLILEDQLIEMISNYFINLISILFYLY